MFLVGITGYSRLEFAQSHPMTDSNSIEVDRFVFALVERTQEDDLHLQWAPLLVDSLPPPSPNN